MSSRWITARARLSVATLALCCAGGAAAQEGDAFRIDERFQPGETWRARTEMRTVEAPLGREGEEETTTIVWTESAEVLDRPQGFALRSTLTGWRMHAVAPNVETRITYDDDDLQTIRIGQRELEFARTWTYEFDPTWRLLAVTGQERTIKQLYARVARDMAGDRPARRWFLRRFGPWMVERWSQRLEAWLVRSNNEGSAPVRVVMERLRAGDAIEDGFEARVPATGALPTGKVRYVGRGDAGAEFRMTFDVTGDTPAPEYAFAIDDAGRLTWLEATGTRIVREDGRGKRVTTHYAYALQQVTPPDERPDVDARDIGDEGAADEEIGDDADLGEDVEDREDDEQDVGDEDLDDDEPHGPY
ncbi:MAG: hypothetical protein M9894_09520 [Planctomycetes bacterium]|nr:hypothetical protein [Planctomycetota bacterium]